MRFSRFPCIPFATTGNKGKDWSEGEQLTNNPDQNNRLTAAAAVMSMMSAR